jgi:hypothetical protein
MKRFLSILLLLLSVNLFSQSKINYIKVSQQLLQNIKEKKPYHDQVAILAKSTLKELENELKTDPQKIAFWLNVYNGFIQIYLSKKPTLYKERGTFFSEKQIRIAGELLSFADIEHGIIRKSKVELGLGYLRKWFPPKYEQKLRVTNLDWRIHFALNCGAKDCPPIAIYSPENLEQALNFMTTSYLKEQTTYNPKTKTTMSVSLFSWFRGDFGGVSGALKILKTYRIVPKEAKELDFKEYKWALSLGNFRTRTNK